jgi:hypothetical protein
MDPAAMSVGLRVLTMWKILASQRAEARVVKPIYEKEPVAIEDS